MCTVKRSKAEAKKRREDESNLEKVLELQAVIEAISGGNNERKRKPQTDGLCSYQRARRIQK